MSLTELEQQARIPLQKLVKTSRNYKALGKLVHFNSRLHSDEAKEYAMQFVPQPSDVFVVTYPKSGTTWLSHIAHSIRSNCSMKFDEIDTVVPWDVAAQECGRDLDADQGFMPRLFKSHLSALEIAKGARYVVLVRNPQRVLVSLWRFFCQGDWPSYAGFHEGEISVRAFAVGIFASAFNSGVWGQIVSWYRCCWASRSTLWLTYEDLIDSPAPMIQQLAEFILPDLHDVLAQDAGLLERVRACTTKEFMLEHGEQFDDHYVLACLAPFKRRGAPAKPHVNKVQAPPNRGPDSIRPDKDVVELLDRRWARIVEPATGFSNYAELRAAIGARANWTAEDYAAATLDVESRRHVAEGTPWRSLLLFVLSMAALLAMGHRRRWGTQAVTLVQRKIQQWHLTGSSLLPRSSADKAACVSSARGQAGLRRRRGDGLDDEQQDDSGEDLKKVSHIPGRATIAAALAFVVFLVVLLVLVVGYAQIWQGKRKAEKDAQMAHSLCEHWHPGECQAPLADLVERGRATLVVSCFKEDLRWLAEAPRARDGVWVYVHNHTGHKSSQGALSKWRARGSEPALEDPDSMRASLEDNGVARFVDIPNVGDEASAYLQFLVDHYDALPEAIVFSHGHQSSQRHAQFNMAELLKCLCTDAQAAEDGQSMPDSGEPSRPPRKYRSLNSGISGEPMCFKMGRLSKSARPGAHSKRSARPDRLDEPRGIIEKHWPTYFAAFLGAELPKTFCMDCCAQFLVSREEVRVHPRELYQGLLAGVLNHHITGLEMEIFWRVLFVGREENAATVDTQPAPRRRRPGLDRGKRR